MKMLCHITHPSLTKILNSPLLLGNMGILDPLFCNPGAWKLIQPPLSPFLHFMIYFLYLENSCYIKLFIVFIPRAQGALLAHVKAEHLMSHNDYVEWKKIADHELRDNSNARDTARDGDGKIRDEDCKTRDIDNKSRDEYALKMSYERLSCRAWTNLLFQIIKVHSSSEEYRDQ